MYDIRRDLDREHGLLSPYRGEGAFPQHCCRRVLHRRTRRKDGCASRQSPSPIVRAPAVRRANARVEISERTLGFVEAPDQEEAWTAPASAYADEPRSRETSAISASASTHLARATPSFGPHAALRRRAFARTKIVELRHRVPQSARAGASRRATRFNAPAGFTRRQ